LVKLQAAAVVPPIAGGLARYVEKPVPDTVLEADNVVNAPVLAVVAPTVVPSILPPVMTALLVVTLPVKVEPVRVNPVTVVVVLPRYRLVPPSVIAVAKLESNCDSGIELVAVAKVYGTDILEPHS